MKKNVLLITILSLFVCIIGFAGEKPKAMSTKSLILSGKIIDTKSNESLAGVKIICTNAEKVIYSDLDGHFFIYIEVKSSENFTLEVTQIGYSSKTLDLKDLQTNSGNLLIDLEAE